MKCANNYFEGQFTFFQFTKIFQYVGQINQLHAFPQTHSYIIITNWELHWTYFEKYKQKFKRANNFLVDCMNPVGVEILAAREKLYHKLGLAE